MSVLSCGHFNQEENESSVDIIVSVSVLSCGHFNQLFRITKEQLISFSERTLLWPLQLKKLRKSPRLCFVSVSVLSCGHFNHYVLQKGYFWEVSVSVLSCGHFNRIGRTGFSFCFGSFSERTLLWPLQPENGFIPPRPSCFSERTLLWPLQPKRPKVSFLNFGGFSERTLLWPLQPVAEAMAAHIGKCFSERTLLWPLQQSPRLKRRKKI